jgi:hypothetical protein
VKPFGENNRTNKRQKLLARTSGKRKWQEHLAKANGGNIWQTQMANANGGSIWHNPVSIPPLKQKTVIIRTII